MKDIYRIVKLSYKKRKPIVEYFEVKDFSNVLFELDRLENFSKKQVIDNLFSSIILRVESLHVFDEIEEPMHNSLKQWSILLGNNYVSHIKGKI